MKEGGNDGIEEGRKEGRWKGRKEIMLFKRVKEDTERWNLKENEKEENKQKKMEKS